MCLEDRFLFALYNQPGTIRLTAMADQLSITENALLSIIHRVSASYPEYLTVQNHPDGSADLCSRTDLQQEVRLFLADGGFTAVNEQELRDYYDVEMEHYTNLQKIKHTLARYAWIRWAAGTLLTIGAGAGIKAFIRSLKK